MCCVYLELAVLLCHITAHHRSPPNVTLYRVSCFLLVPAPQVTENAAFIDDLDADSLDLVELILNLEESFGVEISDEKAQELKTVGDAQKLIDDLKK